MGQIDDLLRVIKEHKKKWEITESSSMGAKLRYQIMEQHHTDDEWLVLQEELRKFIASNPPEEEMAELQGCGESLAMICSAIKEKRI